MARSKRRDEEPEEHFKDCTLIEKRMVKDYIATGNKSEAGRRNLNCKNAESNKAASSIILSRPHVKEAIKVELAKLDEEYIEKGLVALEQECKDTNDRSTRRNVYETMIKLKGLGSTKIINENIEKKEFEFHNPSELKTKLVESIKELHEAKMVSLPELIEELQAISPHGLEGPEAEVVEVNDAGE